MKTPRSLFKNMPSSAKTLIILTVILAAAFLIRLGWITHIDPSKYPRSIPTGVSSKDPNFLGYDGVRYDWIATNLLENNTFGYHAGVPDSWRSPGYPFFLYACYLVFGQDDMTVRLIQSLLSCLIVVLVFLITRNLTGSNATSLLASGFFAISYDSVLFTSIFYSEPLSSFCCLLSILLLQTSLKKEKISWPLLFLGYAILAFAVLVRPGNLIFFAFAVFFGIGSKIRNIKTSAIILITATLAFAVVVFPWSYRNFKLYGKGLLISSNGGQVFFLANHPKSFGTFVPEPGRYSPQQQKELNQPGLDEVEKNKIHYRYGLGFIKNNPGPFAYLICKKQSFLWTYPENRNKFADFLSNIPLPLMVFNLLAILSVPGFLFAFKEIKKYILLIGYVLSYCLVVSVFFYYHGPRTRIELIPFLSIFASAGLFKLWHLFKFLWCRSSKSRIFVSASRQGE